MHTYIFSAVNRQEEGLWDYRYMYRAVIYQSLLNNYVLQGQLSITAPELYNNINKIRTLCHFFTMKG